VAYRIKESALNLQMNLYWHAVIQRGSIQPSKQFLLAIKKSGITVHPQKLNTYIPFFDQYTNSRYVTTNLVSITECLY
jgi:hypothetical protein